MTLNLSTHVKTQLQNIDNYETYIKLHYNAVIKHNEIIFPDNDIKYMLKFIQDFNI